MFKTALHKIHWEYIRKHSRIYMNVTCTKSIVDFMFVLLKTIEPYRANISNRYRWKFSAFKK